MQQWRREGFSRCNMGDGKVCLEATGAMGRIVANLIQFQQKAKNCDIHEGPGNVYGVETCNLVIMLLLDL